MDPNLNNTAARIPAGPLQPLGDQAVLASFPDEDRALHFAERVRQHLLEGVVDVVQAYTTVAVYYDLQRIRYVEMVDRLQPLLNAVPDTRSLGRLHQLPCCYELQQDLQHVTQLCGLSADEVIRLHTGTIYTVYAIGFCPGFPYLGYLPPPLVGVPRLATPRPRVEAGSVGMTGRQTGVYTLPRPGGWCLIGRTPLILVDVAANYFPLRTGDRIQFVRIQESDFRQLEGERL
jgi:inhibitor of KinA